MYKFTLNNILCPTQSMGTGSGGYHIKLRVDVPEQDSSIVIKMTGDYTYRFVNLIHRVVNKISANPLYDVNGVAVTNGVSQIQSNNYLVGC
jgi:hypothetical protein